MKLSDLKKGDKIMETLSDGSTYAIFDHVDGMYSYCTTEKGGVIHFSASMPLVKVDDHYEIDKGDEKEEAA